MPGLGFATALAKSVQACLPCRPAPRRRSGPSVGIRRQAPHIGGHAGDDVRHAVLAPRQGPQTVDDVVALTVRFLDEPCEDLRRRRRPVGGREGRHECLDFAFAHFDRHVARRDGLHQSHDTWVGTPVSRWNGIATIHAGRKTWYETLHARPIGVLFRRRGLAEARGQHERATQDQECLHSASTRRAMTPRPGSYPSTAPAMNSSANPETTTLATTFGSQ